MLNKVERLKVLKLYKICSIFGLLPIQVDVTSWGLKVASTRKRWTWFLFGSSLVMHSIYKNGSLAYAYFFDTNAQYHQLVIHAVLSIGSLMCVFWYERLYMSNSEQFGEYLKMTLLVNVGGLMDPSVNHYRTRRLKEYSIQDLVASSLAYIYMLVIKFVVAAYIYDPTMRLLVYTALPIRHQTWTTFGICTLEEARFLLVMMAIGTPVWQLQVISYDLVSNQLQLLIQQIENGIQTTSGVFEVLRSCQLYVSLANDINCYLVFTWKLTCITISTLTGYSAVAHFQHHPIFGVMYYVMLFDVAFSYAVVYNKGFKIPELFDQAAACALLHRRGRRTDIFRRQIRSIPRAGIKVGNFHVLERASTPSFIDFVLKNIVNLLVAYG